MKTSIVGITHVGQFVVGGRDCLLQVDHVHLDWVPVVGLLEHVVHHNVRVNHNRLVHHWQLAAASARSIKHCFDSQEVHALHPVSSSCRHNVMRVGILLRRVDDGHSLVSFCLSPHLQAREVARKKGHIHVLLMIVLRDIGDFVN